MTGQLSIGVNLTTRMHLPSLGGIVFFIGGISLMGALMVFIGFENRDGEALFWGICLLLPLLIAALLTVSKTLQRVSLAIVSNTVPQRGLVWGTKRGTFHEPTAPADVGPRLKA